MTKLSIIGIILFVFPALILAHGPTPQKAKESISINAPVDKVWDVIKDFGSISKWHGDIKDSKGDGRLESGGSRTLTFQNGEEIVDELDFYHDKDHEYSYRLKKENVKALPTSSYSVSVVVTAGASPETSEVTFKSRFYRGDTGNTPPDNLNDEAAVKAMNAYFKTGLDGLKKMFEN